MSIDGLKYICILNILHHSKFIKPHIYLYDLPTPLNVPRPTSIRDAKRTVFPGQCEGPPCLSTAPYLSAASWSRRTRCSSAVPGPCRCRRTAAPPACWRCPWRPGCAGRWKLPPEPGSRSSGAATPGRGCPSAAAPGERHRHTLTVGRHAAVAVPAGESLLDPQITIHGQVGATFTSNGNVTRTSVEVNTVAKKDTIYTDYCIYSSYQTVGGLTHRSAILCPKPPSLRLQRCLIKVLNPQLAWWNIQGENHSFL